MKWDAFCFIMSNFQSFIIYCCSAAVKCQDGLNHSCFMKLSLGSENECTSGWEGDVRPRWFVEPNVLREKKRICYCFVSGKGFGDPLVAVFLQTVSARPWGLGESEDQFHTGSIYLSSSALGKNKNERYNRSTVTVFCLNDKNPVAVVNVTVSLLAGGSEKWWRVLYL